MERSKDTDYTKLEGADFLHALGDDAAKWAEAFCQTFPDAGIDEGTMIAWFANAIEHSHDIRTGHIINGEHAQYLIDKGLTPFGQQDAA